MGGGHHEPYEVPHHTIYDNWKRCPELVEYDGKLQRIGLSDPWIRNYVVNYDLKYGIAHKTYHRIWQIMSPGMKTGFFLTCLVVGLEESYTYFKYGYTSWQKEH